MKDWVVFLFVHLVVPIIGIIFYLKLIKKIKQENIPNAPTTQLFWIFGTYGVVLILILTSIMWKWSGMASIGGLASISIGPIITAITAASVFKNRNLTKYHKLTFWLSIGYICFMAFLVLLSFIYTSFY